MKTLLILRHGKSDWDAEHEDDHDRPLTRRGRKAAERMGRFLARRGELPEQVVSSTAARALETVERAVDAGDWSAPVVRTRRLYEAGVNEALAVIREVDDRWNRVLLAGHEPTWSELISALTGARVAFPTAAVARVDLEIPAWLEAGAGTGTLIWLVTPRLLKKSRHSPN